MKYYIINKDVSKIDDNMIRLAGTVQLRVLLIALKNESGKFTAEQIASDLKKDAKDIEEAVEFWINLKVMKSESSQESGIDLSKIMKRRISKKINKEYLIKRIESDKEINYLLGEVESIMGRPLSGTDISLMLSLKDNEGIPCSVILMLVQYCVKLGKGSTRYIEKVGMDWAQHGIDSVEKAEKKIKLLNNSKKLWRKFEKIIGISSRTPTSKEQETILRWFTEWKFDEEMIKEAYERCVNAKGSYILSYMDGIIKKWKKKNINNIDDAKKEKPTLHKAKSPSYNLDEYASFSSLDL